ncbi:hypothetical protein SLS64_001735 [Diaporthe eres]
METGTSRRPPLGLDPKHATDNGSNSIRANYHVVSDFRGVGEAYKLVPPPTQLLLADPGSIQSDRAKFARHHLWVTKYKDDEFYVGGVYPFMTRAEEHGVADAAARNDIVEDEDLVLWSVFGLTHNPRVEDWPVM